MSRPRGAGFTLIEVMIAIGVLSLMLVVAWGTVVQTSRATRHFSQVQDRYREARNAMARMVSDLEMAYLSNNEDRTVSDPRTSFIGASSGDVSPLHFSAFAHTRLYADANESDQTVIGYFSAPDPIDRTKTDVMRRETRRLPNPHNSEKWDTAAGETDVLFAHVSKLKFLYFDSRDKEWKESWSTQGVDAGANRLPSRVRISLSFVDEEGKEITLTTQARLMLQEMVLSRAK